MNKSDPTGEQAGGSVAGDWLQFEGQTVRERLVHALRYELLGPEHADEVLMQSPATRYLAGMLAPRGAEMDPVEDDQLEADAGAEESLETAVPVSRTLAPSSIGISFVVDADEKCNALQIIASWGEYEKVEQPLTVPLEEANEVDRDEDPNVTIAKKRRPVYEWRRIPHSVQLALPSLAEGRSPPVSVGSDIHLEWLVRTVANRAVISVFLVNARLAPAGRRAPDEMWLYQPELRVTGDNAPFIARTLKQSEDSLPDVDPDVASADLVYRKQYEFATGHGVAVDWDVDSALAGRATAVWTNVLPMREVPIVKPWGADDLPPLDMMKLGQATDADAVAAMLSPLLDAYGTWIAARHAETATLSAGHSSVAHDHVALAEQCLSRMKSGLELLRSDPIAFDAFCFANRAMALQREASVRVLRSRRGLDVPSFIEKKWRPFQIGFILACLKGIADPLSEDRDIADLLWFPTGGGKTEAYLGLTAFTLAHRRLRGDIGDRDSSAGTAVLMRYTLRLLTIQQFQRATALICACELLRNEDPNIWGEEPFMIGLWVGGTVTPNSYTDSKDALERLKRDEAVREKSPYQVVYCPWCGEDMPAHNYSCDDDLERTLIKCSNRECPFSMTKSQLGLPVLLVDEEIYRNPPSMLLATVDKFAQMAWNGRIQSLFGRVTKRCPRHGFISAGEAHPNRHGETRGWGRARVEPVQKMLAPPDLIIQDELHLISGPLGTLVGIYESAVDGLSSRTVGTKRVRPKVIASTATIRRASQQMRALFNREVAVFPPQGLEAGDSFFARQDPASPGRLYLGVFAPGKSIKTSLVRIYAAMLCRALAEYEATPTTEADAYMTLVGYFNSLRELGGALRLVDDDVPARLRVLQRRGFGPRRLLYEKSELTSRVRSSEIASTLKQLERTFSTKERGRYPIDVLLASNMLSVGVDIDRLGLMVVTAQPKTSAEYIQATSRVGRVFPGLVIESYNWSRPRDTSHYERFRHYHDTFYRHVEATSVTPFSARARDRALPGVLVSYLRLDDPNLSAEQSANAFDPMNAGVSRVIEELVARAYDVTERDDVRTETEQQLKNLTAEWKQWTSPPAVQPLVYTGRGLTAKDPPKTALLQPMEYRGDRGLWQVAGSLREVEGEIPLVLLDPIEELQ